LSKIPAENPHSATEKMLWVREHFPYLGDKIILTPDKGCVGSQRDFLIDDHPEWANANNKI
jgi:5'(3')-deoxyribonucleotidase